LESLGDDLAKWLSNFRRAVIVGIGNPLRHDDGVGIEVVKELKGKALGDTILLIESESVPEDFVEPIVEFKPSHILIIDAALLGVEPGFAKLTSSSEISGIAISTHALPVQIFCSYLKKVTGAEVGLLLIQPENVDFGEGLSPELRRAVDKVVDVLLRILPR